MRGVPRSVAFVSKCKRHLHGRCDRRKRG